MMTTRAARIHDTPSSSGGGDAIAYSVHDPETPDGGAQCHGPPRAAGTKVLTSRCQLNVTALLASGTRTWPGEDVRLRA